jgi:SAM-dependent methyltransferase
MNVPRDVLQREVEYHERLYSGFAQKHFSKAAVRELRAHLVGRMLSMCQVGLESRVLSLGCGIGDTELLLAPHVGELIGVDLSPAGIRQAQADAATAGLMNARFLQGMIDDVEGEFDFIYAIFFLHHLPDESLPGTARTIASRLRPDGWFYSLDPNRYRLSGALGKLFVPNLMRKYQTPDERELPPSPTVDLFRQADLEARLEYYDMLSTPLGGLLPGWRSGYRAVRAIDEVFLRIPLFRRFGSNFEVIARKPAKCVPRPNC